MGKRAGWFAAAWLVAVLVGCGGSGTTTADPGPGDGPGRVAGNLGVDAAGAVVRLDGTALTVVCAPDGSFAFDGVAPGEYTVSVETAGGQGGAATIRVSPGDTVVVPPIALGVAGQLTGLVSDLATRRPLAGARVLARRTPLYEGYAPAVDPDVAAGLGNPAGRQDDDPVTAEPPRVALTGADGSFRFGGVTPGPYSLEITLAGYESGDAGTWVESGRTGVADVFLRAIDPANATVSGQVTSTGGPSAGALAQVRVELWPEFDGTVPEPPVALLPMADALDSSIDPFYLPPFYQIRAAFTDEQGRYSIRNVPPGRYRLTFRRYGYTDIARSIVLGTAEQRTESAALVYRLTVLSGRVVRVTNGAALPVATAEVWASTWWGIAIPARQNGPTEPAIYPSPVGTGSAVTDAAGRFRLEVEAGQVSLGAYHREYGSGYREVTVPAGGLTGVELELEPFDEPGPVDVGGGTGGSPGAAG